MRSKAGLSQLNLAYRTETTTKKCKTEKLKSRLKTGMLIEVIVKVWGIRVVRPEEEKERLRWKGLAEKEVFKPGMKSVSG